MSSLPEKFNEFSEARKNGFIRAKELKDQGKHIIGTFCTYTPNEIMHAAGLYPVSLCGMSEEPIPDAEKHLPKNLCPLIKSSYGFAITDKCPYTYFADMLIGETTCDGKKKMYELLGNIKNVHVMQLPQVQNSLTSLNMWKSEILRLKEVLEKEFQVEITEEKLKEAFSINFPSESESNVSSEAVSQTSNLENESKTLRKGLNLMPLLLLFALIGLITEYILYLKGN